MPVCRVTGGLHKHFSMGTAEEKACLWHAFSGGKLAPSSALLPKDCQCRGGFDEFP